MLQAWLATGIYWRPWSSGERLWRPFDIVPVSNIGKQGVQESFFCDFVFLFARVLACVASVSVWFRTKGRPRNGILGFGRARNETRAKKWKWGEGEGPSLPRSFTYAIFRAVFDSRSSCFAPKPHGNACYAGYTRADKFLHGQILFLDRLFRDGPLEKSACTNFCFRSLLVQEFFFRWNPLHDFFYRLILLFFEQWNLISLSLFLCFINYSTLTTDQRIQATFSCKIFSKMYTQWERSKPLGVDFFPVHINVTCIYIQQRFLDNKLKSCGGNKNITRITYKQ